MDLKLAGKTALITGASKGIGGAAAEMLAAEGCHLVLVARTAGDLARAKESIARKANVSVETVPADLSDSANVTRLAREFPDIDILVNNAGAIPGGKLLDIDEATWRSAWDLKVFGYINMCRAFYALMKARHAGVIINVVGNAAQTHDPDYICGVTGNAALTAFTQSLGSVEAGARAHRGFLGIGAASGHQEHRSPAPGWPRTRGGDDRPSAGRLLDLSHNQGLVHRFLGTDHFRRIHVIHDGLYPGF